MEKQKFRIEKDRLYTDDGQVYQLTLISEEKQEPAKAEYPKILEFKTPIYGKIYTLNEDGRYWGFMKYLNLIAKYTLDEILTANPENESDKVLIWKVAKNESEVFVVGDLTNKGKILEFEYDHGGINIYTDAESWLCSFEGLEHKKEPILTTEDGVEIYDEHQIIYVLMPILDWKKSEREAMYNEKSNLKFYFSTYESRESYIKDYTKMYSRKQIKEAIKKSSMVLFSRDEYLRINELNYISEKELIKTLDL